MPLPAPHPHLLTAIHAALAGGRAITGARRLPLDVWEKGGGEMVTSADIASNAQIRKSIARSCKESDPIILSEEDDPAGVYEGLPWHHGVWVIDPLDGTREVSDPASTNFAVSVGFVDYTGPRMGAVYFPAREIGYAGARGTRPVTFDRNGETHFFRREEPVRNGHLVVSKSVPEDDPVVRTVIEAGGTVTHVGSCVNKLAMVLTGAAAAYYAPASTKVWDVAGLVPALSCGQPPLTNPLTWRPLNLGRSTTPAGEEPTGMRLGPWVAAHRYSHLLGFQHVTRRIFPPQPGATILAPGGMRWKRSH